MVLVAVVLLIPTFLLGQADAGVAHIRVFANEPVELYVPYDVATDELGNVYVVDHLHRLVKYNKNGAQVWSTGGEGAGSLYYPEGVAYGNGQVYVADTGNDKIKIFSTGGTYQGSFGEPGAEPGQFKEPNGIAIRPQDGNVYVTDGQNHNVSIFGPNGNFISAWGSYGDGSNQFSKPSGIAFDNIGAMYVTNQAGHLRAGREGVMIYYPPNQDATGSFVVDEGGTPSFPDGITVNPEGTEIWVAESGTSRVSKFVQTGIAAFEREFSFVGELSYPHGVALNGQDHLFVASTNTSLVHEYANKAPKLEVSPGSTRKRVADTNGLWFTLFYNQVDATCQITGRMTVEVPGHDAFKVDGDVPVPANGIADLKLDLSAKQVKWMKKAWDKGKKVSMDGKFSGPCSDDVKISTKHDQKL